MSNKAQKITSDWFKDFRRNEANDAKHSVVSCRIVLSVHTTESRVSCIRLSSSPLQFTATCLLLRRQRGLHYPHRRYPSEALKHWRDVHRSCNARSGKQPRVVKRRDKKWEETWTRKRKAGEGKKKPTRLCVEASEKEDEKKWEESTRPVQRSETERGIRFLGGHRRRKKKWKKSLPAICWATERQGKEPKIKCRHRPFLLNRKPIPSPLPRYHEHPQWFWLGKSLRFGLRFIRRV